METIGKVMCGAGATLALAVLSHNLGNGEKLIASLQGQAESALETDERFSDVNLAFERAPMTRVALMSGSLEGEERVDAMALVRKIPGVSGVRWADAKTVAQNLKGASFPITNGKTEEDLAIERRLAAIPADNGAEASVSASADDTADKAPAPGVTDAVKIADTSVAGTATSATKNSEPKKPAKPEAVELADNKATPPPANPATAYAVKTPATPVAAAPSGSLAECQKRVDTLMGGDAISFRSGSPWVNFKVRAKLATLVQDLGRCGTVNLAIAGHADNRGPAAINQSLSQARADAVRDVLVDKGFAASRITTKGLGGSANGRTISFTVTPANTPAKGGN